MSLVDVFGHKPSCNDAGNPPDCTCEAEAGAALKLVTKQMADNIDQRITMRYTRQFDIDRSKSWEYRF